MPPCGRSTTLFERTIFADHQSILDLDESKRLREWIRSLSELCRAPTSATAGECSTTTANSTPTAATTKEPHRRYWSGSTRYLFANPRNRPHNRLHGLLAL